jgi:hypothetical protein
MRDLNHFKIERRKVSTALVVLIAVCSLTVSLATRYSSSEVSPKVVRTVQTHPAPDARQRLTKNAAIWIRPVFSFTALQAPSFYPLIAPTGAPIPNFSGDENIYNRPPPAFLS